MRLERKLDAQTEKLIDHDVSLRSAWGQVQTSHERSAASLESIERHQVKITALMQTAVKQGNGPLIRWLVWAVILAALGSKALELAVARFGG
jgi:hypothetical protein